MLKGIEIENFKAFGQRNFIDFAPITLIFGENSAGKTTILHSLNLLKQTRENRDKGALLLPRAEGGLVDLGGFQELLFDHDLSRSLKLRFIIDVNESDLAIDRRMALWFSHQHREDKVISIEFVFSRPSEKDEITISQLIIATGKTHEPLAIFNEDEISLWDQRMISRDFFMMRQLRRRGGREQLRAMKCIYISGDSNIWKNEFTNIQKQRDKILRYLERYYARLNSDVRIEEHEEHNSRNEQEEKKRAFEEAIQFYSSNIELNAFIERMMRCQLGSVIGLDGFSPFSFSMNHSQSLPEEIALNRFPGARTSDLFLDVGRIAVYAGRLFEDVLDRLFPMGPFRRPPERWYIFAGTSPHDVGYKGELLPDFLYRRPEMVKQTNKWLERLDIGYQLEVLSAGTRSRDLFEVRLRDMRRKEEVEVGLSDVGFGISQLLPFIVQSLCGEKRIISIEQPEVHVHPKLQADIGDLVAETIKEPYKHRFIIETHSEHLILRLQSLVRNQVLSPDDVSVIYVSRGENGAQAKRLHLNDQGEFIDEWPGGFFTERLRELL